MKACILVGGYGTRLRPLTFTKPKPLVPFCNIPMILHQIIALADCGVTQIIFLMSRESIQLKEECEAWTQTFGIHFSFCYEETPLGTAGPLRRASELGLLDEAAEEPFFLLNSDIVCEYPFKKLLDKHRQAAGEATLLVTKVSQWSRYGVVQYEEHSGLIHNFIEKPSTFVGDRINAGIYVLHPKIIRKIPPGKCSIEREVFPAVAYAKKLFCAELTGMWMDIGNPIDFLDAIPLYVDLVTRKSVCPRLLTTLSPMIISETDARLPCTIIGRNIVDPSSKIHPDAVIGPNVAIGARCEIQKGARLEHSVVLSGTTVQSSACITRSILGWNCSIGGWVHCVNGVLGEDVHVSDRCIINGVRALPHVLLSSNVFDPQIVM